ncbi:hypothetical protein R2F25_14875 [Streptomyces sp. UP1A-1]|nr:hypothetical protein [Streptomyces sp. UP1A-1]
MAATSVIAPLALLSAPAAFATESPAAGGVRDDRDGHHRPGRPDVSHRRGDDALGRPEHAVRRREHSHRRGEHPHRRPVVPDRRREHPGLGDDQPRALAVDVGAHRRADRAGDPRGPGLRGDRRRLRGRQGVRGHQGPARQDRRR